MNNKIIKKHMKTILFFLTMWVLAMFYLFLKTK